MQKKPPTPEIVNRVAGECIAVRVRLINRVITSIYEEALRPYGIRISQGNILVVVAKMGQARPADVARLLRLERSTLSRDVDVMKRARWLVSDPPEGGRSQTLRVTSEGLRLLADSQPAWEKAQAETRKLLGDGGVDAIRRIAAELGMGRHPD
jgi:DNA-binding MarR family transcriptional regulator